MPSFLTNSWILSQRASSEPLRLTVAILTTVSLSAFFSEFPQAARAKPATVARAATPSHFLIFMILSPLKIIP